MHQEGASKASQLLPGLLMASRLFSNLLILCSMLDVPVCVALLFSMLILFSLLDVPVCVGEGGPSAVSQALGDVGRRHV
jgi:succinate-acetate transporter protein